MGSRNRQRATFQKRQREMARQERQAEKRARRQGKEPVVVEHHDAPPASDLPPGIGQYPSEIGRYPSEVSESSQESHVS